MTESNTALVRKLKWLADYMADELGWVAGGKDVATVEDICLAAQRLESLSQVSEAEVDAAHRGFLETAQQIKFGSDDTFESYMARFLTIAVPRALEAARKAKP